MATLIYPHSASLLIAGVIREYMGNATVHLFKPSAPVLSAAVTKAQLEAHECDFTGYAPITVGEFTPPLLNPLGGASIQTGTVQFASAPPYTVGNMARGFYVVTNGGDLWACGDFPQPVAFGGAGDGVPLDIQLIYG